MSPDESSSRSHRPNGEPREKSSQTNRRAVLETVATGALLGTAVLAGTGSATASDPESDPDRFRVESLSPGERGQLRGDILSSRAFKTVRQSMRREGYRAKLGDVTMKRVIDTERGYRRDVMKLRCEYEGNEGDGRRRGAVMFAHRDDEEVFARCISQCEGEPVYVRECAVGRGDRGPGGPEEELVTTEIPTAEGGVE